MPLAQSADYGINLQTVQLFMKKNQVSTALPCQCHPPLLQKASYSTLALLLVALGSPDTLTEQLWSWQREFWEDHRGGGWGLV